MKHLWKKVTAWVLAVALVASGVTITGKTAQAADGAYDSTTRSYSGNVSATISAQSGNSSDWSGFEITLTNNTGQTITDWIIVLKVSTTIYNAFSKVWSSTCVLGGDGQTIYIYPQADGANATLASGTMTGYYPGMGFTTYVTTSDITVSTVYYNYGTSSSYSYANGSTYDSSSSSGSGSSTSDNTTTINEDVTYNFASLLQESLYFYDANMCGTDVDECCDLSWRSDCHTNDQYATYNGVTVDVSGGYHDAGDHVKFGLPQAYAASVLGMSYYEYGDAFDDLGLTDHYKTIMDRFVDYFERCTVLNSDGSVAAFCYQVGNGTIDHSYWGTPEAQDSSDGGRSSYAYFTSSSNPCTDIVCETAAALAIYAVNFNDSKALTYAKALFAYAESNTKKVCEGSDTTSFYSSENYEDDYALAAAWLYIATGDSSYKTYYNNMGLSGCYWVLCWNNVTAAALLYAPDSSKSSYVASYVTSSISSYTQTSDNSYLLLSQWGSARYNTAFQFMGLAYDTETNSSTFSSWAKGQMQYLLGNNAGKHCFIVGYNSYSVKYPHHRAASGYSDVNSNGTTTQAHVLLGALVGGPEYSSTSYVDTATDYTQNEVALDYNATLVAAAAGLYAYVMNNGSDEEKAEQETLSSDEIAAIYATTGDTLRGLYSDSSSEEETILVTGISLTPSTATITTGSTQTITATVTPSSATNQNLTWNSSNTSVATVSSSGVVTGVASGTATITATAKDGSGVKATCTVTVLTPVSSVTLTAASSSIYPGETTSLTATYSPSTADISSTTYSSSNTSVATVSSAGVVTAVAAGTATITVTVTSKDGTSKTGTCTITVKQYATGITLDKTSVDMTVGGATTTVTATVTPSTTTDSSVTWTSSNTSVATVSGGTITAVGKGTATITATTADGSNISATCTVTVTQPVTNVALSSSAVSLYVDETTTLTATVTPSTASDTSVTWSSSNTSVATVNGGKITAVAAGTAVITVTANDGSGKSDSCTVTVVAVGETKKADNTSTPSADDITVTVTSSGVTITTSVSGLEYSIDGGTTYTTSTSFANLEEFTTYTLKVRYAETDDAYASNALSITFTTLISDPYTIDVSRLTETGYMDALVDSDGNITATYDADTNTLTLTQNADYTLIGVNATLIVDDTAAKSVDITNATIGSLKSQQNTGDDETPSDDDDTKGTDDGSGNSNNNGSGNPSTSDGTDNTGNSDNSSNTNTSLTAGSASAATSTAVVSATVGQTVECDNLIYKVLTAADDGTGTVTVTGMVNKKTSTVKIPATITINKVSYNVTEISKKAFKKNKNITKVTVGNNVTKIGANAFKGCAKLKTLKLGKGLTTIGANAFNGCKVLKKVVIPAKVKSIGKKAFYNCKKLKTVKIKSKLLTTKNVKAKAFGKTSKKLTFKVPKKVKKAYAKWLTKKGNSKAKVK